MFGSGLHMRQTNKSLFLGLLAILCCFLCWACPPNTPTSEHTDDAGQEAALVDSSPAEQPAFEEIVLTETPASEAQAEDPHLTEQSDTEGQTTDTTLTPEISSEEAPPTEHLADGMPTANVHLYPPSDPNTLQVLRPTTPAPALQPKLIALTYAGGKGNQTIRSIRFAADGSMIAEGKGFSIQYDANGANGRISGDPNTLDTESTSDRPPLSGDPGRAYSHPPTGLTFRVGYRQAGSNLQMPIFRAFQGTTRVWTLWGHAVQDAIDLKLTADSRCYQAWGMPQGRIGVQCWTDGGNSVLAKDPRDLKSAGFNPVWAQGAYQNSAGGMSSLYALIDTNNGGSVVSGTFVASHVPVLAVDAWGRVYLARTGSSRSGGPGPSNPFNQAATASSGVLALSESLKTALFHARIGGNCAGQQYFTVAALRENLLVLGGTTCAADLQTTQAPQPQHGGDQDAMLAILELWPRP